MEASQTEERAFHKKQKVTFYALFPAILCPLCLLFPYGYSIGTISSAALPLQEFYRQTYLERYNATIDEATLDVLWALTPTFYPLGGVFGAPSVPWLVRKFGRKKSLLLVQPICIVATLLLSLSEVIKSFETLMIGRFLLGIVGAIGTGITPMYISEISASHIRGIIGSLCSVSIVFGILIGNVLGLKQVLGTASGWPYLLAISAIPSVIFILYSPWLPASPRVLYFDMGKPEEAEKVLKRLRGTDDVELEIKSFEEEAKQSSQNKVMTILEVVKTRRVRWQMISVMVLMSSFQLSAINGIQFYFDQVFITAGIPPDLIDYVKLGVLVAELLVTALSGYFCERFGRRFLLLVGYSVICVFMIVYTVMTAFQDKVDWFSYISAVASLGIICGFCIGPSLVYVIAPELLDQSSRPAIMTLGVLVLWISFAIVTFATPYMFDALKFAVFLPFFAVMLASLIFTYIVIPETKGKSLIAIQAIFGKRNKISITATLNNNHKHPAHINPAYEEDSYDKL
ncbi:solute carrier family 2, facilitated glucose transporter member 5-like isoform X1 [Clavelina lepadiformis]|uniref:solute carrier family 2, facilitated glucose transporter member 5-like isoform X1 n=1 Tax=Clavelina lepadiformis TaxID=159417 RepID=UPI004043150B